MEIYQAEMAIKITLTFEGLNGFAYTPSSAEFRVLDQDLAELATWASVSTASGTIGDGVVDVVVSDALNTLTVGNIREARRIEFRLTHSSYTGYYNDRVSYALTDTTELVVMTNSFQTFERAELYALDIAGLDVWETLTNRQKIAALISSYESLNNLTYRVYAGDNALNAYSVISDLSDLTQAEFEALDSNFVADMRRAQIVEADSRMATDTTEGLRRDGIMSITIGESSQFFRTAKPLTATFGISSTALNIVGKYLSYNFDIARS